MATSLRESRSVFRFSGEDARKLLFDVLTSRIVAEEGPGVWWALLSPQGKVQAEGLSIWADGAFWLDVDASVADDFYRRMRMYKLRAKVEIDDLRDEYRVGRSIERPAAAPARPDARAAGLGWHVIAPVAEAASWTAEDETFSAARIAAGIAELGPDFAANEVFPHDIGMDLLGGVDFLKGCYIGQEVVSRMQHRGTARRRPVIVSGLPAGAAAGVPVRIGEREAGTLGAIVQGAAVAILRLDRITDPALARVSGQPVALALPPWASYAFGESEAAD